MGDTVEQAILNASRSIQKLSATRARLRDFENGREYMVRWTNPSGSAKGYDSLAFEAEEVDALVRPRLEADIAAAQKEADAAVRAVAVALGGENADAE